MNRVLCIRVQKVVPIYIFQAILRPEGTIVCNPNDATKCVCVLKITSNQKPVPKNKMSSLQNFPIRQTPD